ncbi:MAG TPA: hypothetical protein VGH15_06070, partial [Caulobacteraceae bacterium]
ALSDRKISESKLDAAIEFALDDDEFETPPLDPSRLLIAVRFTWLHFEHLSSSNPSEDLRNEESIIIISLGGGKLFIQPVLIFPAPWKSKDLRDFLRQVEPALPFRLRDNYFQRWLPSSTGKSRLGRFLNLPPDWRRSA